MGYQQLADAVLVLHALVVAFVVGGLVAIVAGNFLGWRWVNSRWFRLLHLLAIAIVAAQSWLGVACPLTWLETQLRLRAQQSTYGASFIEHWLQALLYYQAPGWAFIAAYTLFGLAVAACWWIFPPRPKRQRP
jgi:hypothetical protein